LVNYPRMKNNLLRTALLVFLFSAGNLQITRNIIAQDADSYDAAVQLDEINVFDNQEGELLDPDWLDLESKLVQLKETIQAITQVEADESEPSDPEEQIAEQPEAETDEAVSQETEIQMAESLETEAQEVETQIPEVQEVEPDEAQPQETPEEYTQEIDVPEADEEEVEQIETAKEDTEEDAEDEAQGEAVKASETVELNGDTVEYSIDGNKIIAQGNVIVINKDMDLYCDRIEFSRDTSMAYATGNVRLVMKKGEASEMTGDKLTFDFKTMEGSFDGAHIYAKPYYGYGGKVSKAGKNVWK